MLGVFVQPPPIIKQQPTPSILPAPTEATPTLTPPIQPPPSNQE